MPWGGVRFVVPGNYDGLSDPAVARIVKEKKQRKLKANKPFRGLWKVIF